jgi:hypothetical protein
VVAVLAGYIGLGLVVLAPEGVYTGDIGVKYVQARDLAANRFGSLRLTYPGEFLDPERAFFPLRPPFIMTSGGTTQAIFPPAAAIVHAIPVWIAGIRGLVLLSIFSAAAILWAAWKLAPAGLGPAAVLVLGIASPLWFYAVVGLEHAPAVALSTLAFVAAARPGPRAALLSGVLVGAAAILRDEAVLVLPGLLFALWRLRRDIRPLALATVAALVPLAAAAAVEVFWFERPFAAHVRHAVHFLQAALHLTSEPNPEIPSLQPFTLEDRYQTVVNYWLAGSSEDAVLGLFAAAFALALLLRRIRQTAVGFLAVLAALLVVAALDLVEVLTAPKWLAGLFRVAPYLALAFIPGPPGAPRQPMATVAVVTAGLFLAIAFVGVDTTGGKSLGPRLLLPIVPLLTIGALVRIQQYWRSPVRLDRLVAAAGGALIAAAAAFHLGGTIPAYVQRNRDDAAAVVSAGRAPARVVVADDPFTAQLLFPLYYRKIVLLAGSRDAGLKLGDALTTHRVAHVLLVSREAQPRVRLDPLQLQRSERHGRMVIQHWRR